MTGLFLLQKRKYHFSAHALYVQVNNLQDSFIGILYTE